MLRPDRTLVYTPTILILSENKYKCRSPGKEIYRRGWLVFKKYNFLCDTLISGLLCQYCLGLIYNTDCLIYSYLLFRVTEIFPLELKGHGCKLTITSILSILSTSRNI